MKADISYLHYSRPEEYSRTLDPDPDPMYEEKIREMGKIEQELSAMDLDEYLKVVIGAFLVTYPDMACLTLMLTEESGDLKNRKKTPIRPAKDIVKIDGIYHDYFPLGYEDPSFILEGDDYISYNAMYCSEFKLTFKDEQPNLKKWVEAALSEVSYTRDDNQFEIEEGPLSKVEIIEKDLILHIRKESYREYY